MELQETNSSWTCEIILSKNLDRAENCDWRMDTTTDIVPGDERGMSKMIASYQRRLLATDSAERGQ